MMGDPDLYLLSRATEKIKRLYGPGCYNREVWTPTLKEPLVEKPSVRKRKKPSVSSFFLAKNDESPYVGIVVFVRY